MSAPVDGTAPKKSPLQEIVQPFIDLMHAPRALWGINLAYVLEGMVYFGILGYLSLHFSDFIFRGVTEPNVHAHHMVMVLTAGITISMFFLGFVADKWGVRQALILAFVLLLAGRVLIAGGPTIFGLKPAGLWSPLHLLTMAGIVLVVIGYGMYQPAAYAGVRQFTTPKTAGMAFAMLYALMNLGGWFPTFAFLLRDEKYANVGIVGVYWVYTFFTALALVCTIAILSRRTVEQAVASAKAETAKIKAEEARRAPTAGEAAKPSTGAVEVVRPTRVPPHTGLVLLGMLVAIYFKVPDPYRWWAGAIVLLGAVLLLAIPATRSFIARHPLADPKFFFFIFALIPVQTLFTYNWLILPPYISRAFEGWIGEYFEIASNANPILIFVLVPIIAAATQKAKVYNMMIIGTLIMAAPAFLLAIGPHWWTLFPYLVIMTIGEAIWQPRFLQYAAEIAPEGRTGQYMGVAQLPWFLTKLLVPALYSGWALERYCPAEGPKNTQTMWLIFSCIAMCSCVLLMLGRGWIGKDMKTKAA